MDVFKTNPDLATTQVKPAALAVVGGSGGPIVSPAAVYLASLSAGSRRSQGAALATIAALCTDGAVRDPLVFPWHTLRHHHGAAVRSALAARFAPATANRMLAAYRGTLKAAWSLGLMTMEEMGRATDIKPVRGARLPSGRALSPEEVGALFDACARDPGPAGRRDAALLAVLYAGGLRRAEAAALMLADVEDAPAPGSGLTIRVRKGKGDKERRVPLTPGAAELVRIWLRVRGGWAGALLPRIGKDGGLDRAGGAISDQSVLVVLNRRRLQAGVRGFSPHDLRRTFIGTLLDAGADLSAAQKLAGHSNPATTARYDRRGERAARAAADLVQIPTRPGKKRPRG